MKVYKYRSPYRPMPMSYIPKEIEFNFDSSDIGAWTPKTIYAFNSPLPDSLIRQWDLQALNTITLPTGEEYPLDEVDRVTLDSLKGSL